VPNRSTELLRNVPLFAGQNNRQLRWILEWTKEFEYKPGATLVEQGKRGQALFVMLEGHAKVLRGARTITRLGPGDFFGETAMLDGRPRTASVVADGPVRCLRLDQQDFRQLVDGDSTIAWNMLVSLAARLRPD
jgi:CRP-like cAMP-binding protein